ncbi:MAG: EamA family transporter [Bacteroidetes bacterium]|nr:EamA family transporter [Bacteroidota bacterium]MBU1720623.1 EamA family transporter [Bacteroidota bacterium]
MPEIIKVLIPVTIASLFNAAANTLWKIHFLKVPFRIKSFSEFWALAFNPYIIGGILFYVASMGLFFYMLSNFKLSLIIPLTALTYLFNIASAYFIFGEKMHLLQWVGLSVIILGIIILSQAPSVPLNK